MKLARYLERYATSIVILSGRERGTEFSLDQHRLTLGRGLLQLKVAYFFNETFAP